MWITEQKLADLTGLTRKALERKRQRGETLDEASAGIGIAKSSLFALESGATRPRLDTLQLLLGYYQIDFEEIA